MSNKICLPHYRRCDVQGTCRMSTEARDEVIQNANLTDVLAEALCLNISEKQMCRICLMSIFRNGLPPQSPVRSDNTRVTRFAPPPPIVLPHIRGFIVICTQIYR